MTIHQFLLKQGWFVPGIFALKPETNQSPYQATTVIVDECSMIPTDLFGDAPPRARLGTTQSADPGGRPKPASSNRSRATLRRHHRVAAEGARQLYRAS